MSNYNKLLSDILRCEEFLKRYINGVPYAECLIPTDPQHLIDIKSSYIYNLDEAKEIAKNTVAIVKDVKEKYMNEHECIVKNDVKERMDKILTEVVKHSLKEHLI